MVPIGSLKWRDATNALSAQVIMIIVASLALELMAERSQERITFGKYLHQHGSIAEWIARSRIEIDQALVPSLHTTVVDRAMQVFGAGSNAGHAPGRSLHLGPLSAYCRWSG
jgi:alkylation response protein AidB-like acyl-CoA dehydrogenase